MVTSCCVLGCRQRFNRTLSISFFRFPLQEPRRSEWQSALKRGSWQPNGYSRICGLHFISGRPSHDANNPDYVPSLNIGTLETLGNSARRRTKLRQGAPKQRPGPKPNGYLQEGSSYANAASANEQSAIVLQYGDQIYNPAASNGLIGGFEYQAAVNNSFLGHANQMSPNPNIVSTLTIEPRNPFAGPAKGCAKRKQSAVTQRPKCEQTIEESNQSYTATVDPYGENTIIIHYEEPDQDITHSYNLPTVKNEALDDFHVSAKGCAKRKFKPIQRPKIEETTEEGNQSTATTVDVLGENTVIVQYGEPSQDLTPSYTVPASSNGSPELSQGSAKGCAKRKHKPIQRPRMIEEIKHEENQSVDTVVCTEEENTFIGQCRDGNCPYYKAFIEEKEKTLALEHEILALQKENKALMKDNAKLLFR